MCHCVCCEIAWTINVIIEMLYFIKVHNNLIFKVEDKSLTPLKNITIIITILKIWSSEAMINQVRDIAYHILWRTCPRNI